MLLEEDAERVDEIRFRCTQIKMYSWDNAQVVLVGNKCDLDQDRAVTLERGQRLADQLGNSSHCCSSMICRACLAARRISSRAYCSLLSICCVVC